MTKCKAQKAAPNRKKKILLRILLPIAVLLVLYTILVYFLVSACLVPSFMNQLDVFEEITVKSYAQQVQTSDIKENRSETLNETKAWLKEAERLRPEQTTEDGYRLVATEFPYPEALGTSHKWVILLHGYTGWKEAMYEFAFHYQQLGYHVLCPDLRCQGESEGDFIGMGYTDSYDCRLWLSYILEKDPEAEIVLHGQSMGAATALIMSGQEDLPEQVKAIVSDCAYTDAYSMFGAKITDWFHLPAFPLVDSSVLMLMARGGYDLRKASAIEAVKKSSTPTLFIHGDADAMIPVEMASELYEAETGDKELLIVAGAGHAQSQDKEPETYYNTIQAFLAKHVQEQ